MPSRFRCLAAEAWHPDRSRGSPQWRRKAARSRPLTSIQPVERWPNRLVWSPHPGRVAGEGLALPATKFSFVSRTAGPALILRDRARLAPGRIRFQERIAMEAYTVKTGAAVRHS